MKTGNKKKQEETFHSLPSSSLRDQVYPILTSMVQAKTSPNPSPTSSTSSRSQPASVTLPAPPLDPEEVEDNSFYIYLRSHFNNIFIRSMVVCIPHSRSLGGLVLTKDFIETHCYNSSPYYRGQYQAANGKVISIERSLISTVSGFREQRTVHIMTEEWVYVGNKKVRVYITQRPLEGEASQQYQKSRNTINIPTLRNSKSDFDFLNMFAENVEPLMELQSAVQEFVDTYVYIRGFNNYTVEKIQHIYTKAYKTMLQRNKLIRDTCRIQAEHDHFLELVENVVMGFLHEKIWIQSLRSILQSQDAYINSICECYSRDGITLQRYAVSYPISEMPLSCFDQAIACLRRTDADSDTPLSNHRHDNPATTNTLASNALAFTPLEKIACVKSTLDLIAAAVDGYAKEVKNGSIQNESSVTTDEMIPLLAYVITRSQIRRIASLAFYIEHFRLSHMERSEHGFALVTLKTAISFLKGDPLSLLDSNSTVSTVSTNSTSSTALSPQLQNLRSRSTSFGSPITSPTFSTQHNTSVYNHYSSSSNTYRLSSYQSTQASKSSSHTSSNMTGSSSQRPPARPLRHRKSQSVDMQCLLDSQQQSSSSSSDSGKEEDYEELLTPTPNRRAPSATPKVRSTIFLQGPNENRRSLDIPNDWMIHNTNASKSSPDLFANSFASPQQPHISQPHHHTHHIQQQPSSHYHNSNHHHHHHLHHGKPTTPPKHVLGHTQPMISTTLPTISNSTPLPGNSPPTSSSSSSTGSNPQYYYYRHQQLPTSPKTTEEPLLSDTMEITYNGILNKGDTRSASPRLSAKPLSSSTRPWNYASTGLEYASFNDVDDANNKLGESLSASTKGHFNSHHQPPVSVPSSPVMAHQRHNATPKPPNVINITDRLSFDGSGRRPASICIDTRSSSMHGRTKESDVNHEDLGDFLLGLRKMDGDIIGESSGQVRMC